MHRNRLSRRPSLTESNQQELESNVSRSLRQRLKSAFCCSSKQNTIEANAEKIRSVDITEHKLPLFDFLDFFKTDLRNGLSCQEAEERLARNGPNQFTPPKTTPEWVKFLKKLFYGFSALLWISLILCLVIFVVTNDMSQVSLRF